MSPKAITFGTEYTGDYSKARGKEWLITNGLGGYASSTIICANTRGYHGLLVASLGSNMRRVLLLSKMEEIIIVNGEVYPLSTNKYPGVISPDGYRHLREFRLDPDPHFIYEAGGVVIHKMVHLPSKTNCTIISYETKTPVGVEITVKPLVSNRGFHERLKENSGITFNQQAWAKGLIVHSNTSPTKLYLTSNFEDYKPSETWYRNIIYDEETDRGYDDREDLYNPGMFTTRMNKGTLYQIVASTDTIKVPEVEAQHISVNTGESSLRDMLIQASTQFIASLPNSDCTIVGGYHWFGEWGRDAAISLPGLLLATRRFEDARKVLRRFLSQTRDGLALNMIGEDGSQNYASIDTSLWLIYAAFKYFVYTADLQFLSDIFPRLVNIIDCYQRGNASVKVAEDGLLESTQVDSSFTWMDARVDGLPVTPRVGKCVEINALYYNALLSLEALSRRLGYQPDYYSDLAGEVKNSFNDAFWFQSGGYLYDYLSDDEFDASIRPNQILSISLPFPILEKEHWGSVYNVVESKLLTPYGLRTLAVNDPKYRGACVGSARERDASYHNGTVWAWLIGPYITAHTRLGFSTDSLIIRYILNSFKQHLFDAGLGSISEIFDGDAPHRPRGCIAQAWSVGELLRVHHEDLEKI